MAQTPDEPRQSDPRGDAYYAALLESWFENRMEKDKTLLALSAGGIALIVSLLSDIKAGRPCQILVFALAAISFLVAIFAGIAVFGRNATYLEREKAAFEAGEPGVGTDVVLIRLDTTVILAFIAGVLLTLGAALVSSSPSSVKECEMAKQPRQTNTKGFESKEKSISGASGMRPGGSPQPQPQPSSGGSSAGGSSAGGAGGSAGGGTAGGDSKGSGK